MNYIMIFNLKATRLLLLITVMCSVSFIARAQKSDTNNSMSLYKQYTGLNLTYKQIGNSEIEYSRSSNASFSCSKNNGAATSANLTLPADAEIQAVYIQWFAMVKHERPGITTYAPLSKTIPITFPDGTTQTITQDKAYADEVRFSSWDINYEGYLADITDKVLAQSNPAGTYTADVILNNDYNNLEEACALSKENARAWQMLVVYKSPTDEPGINQVYIYDGLRGFVNQTVNIPVTGYKVYSGNVAGSISIASLQGDAAISGETINVSDNAFGSFPTDWANSGGYSNPAPGTDGSNGSPYGAWDIDVKNSNFTPNTNNLTLTAGSTGDVILIDLIVLKIPTAALVVDKKTVTPYVNVGKNAMYEVTLQNVSEVDVKGVAVQDVLPSGFTFVETNDIVLDNATQVSVSAPAVGADSLNWGTFDIDGNGSVTVYFTVKTDDNQLVGVYQNGATATVSSPSDTVITNYDSSSSTKDDVAVEDSCDALTSGDLDTDKDGVSDSCDEDDDNDGILDVNEGYCSISLTNNWGTNNGVSPTTSNPHTFGSTTFNTSITSSASIGDDTNTTGGGFSGWRLRLNGQPAGVPVVATIDFATDVNNLAFQIGDLDEGTSGSGKREQITIDIILANGSTYILRPEDFTIPSGYSYHGNNIFQSGNTGTPPDTAVTMSISTTLEGIDKVNFSYTFAGSNANEGYLMIGDLTACAHRDTDNDAVFDYLDTDSDNDGCPDAVEASGNIVPSQLSTLAGGSIGGSSDNLGLVSDSEGHPMVSGSGYQQNTTSAVTDDADYSACTADLSLTKTVSNAVPKKGSYITYTIEITNSGPLEATGVKVSDALPGGVVYNSHTSSLASATYSGGVWNIGTLAVGGSATLQIVALVNTEDVIIENNAQVSSSNQLDIDSVINNGN